MLAMTGTVVFDFTNNRVFVEGASGKPEQLPKNLVLKGTAVSPPPPERD